MIQHWAKYYKCLLIDFDMGKEDLKVYLGADHAGFELKEKIKKFLDFKKISYEDSGTFSEKRVDYSDYAIKVGKRVAKEKGAKGILVCGTGIGMCIAANKVKGIRAAMVYDKHTARLSREHNDANVLCLRGRDFPADENLRLLEIWLEAKFSGEKRHLRRIRKIKEYENRH